MKDRGQALIVIFPSVVFLDLYSSGTKFEDHSCNLSNFTPSQDL